MSSDNWRIPTDAATYMGAQKKRAELEQRRPVVRRAADLVGPGIGGSAVVITDYNDTLALFDGYFASGNISATANAQGRGARNGPIPIVGGPWAGYDFNPYVGITAMDGVLGGTQRFTNVVSGNIYTRIFLRNPSDPTSVTFGSWKWENKPIEFPEPVAPLPREMAYAQRTTSTSTTNTAIFGGSAMAGLAVTVVGEGKPVEIIFDALISHSANNANVGVWFNFNGSSDFPAGAIAFTGNMNIPAIQTIILNRRIVLALGTTYNITVGWYGSAGTTGTNSTPQYPASLRVNRLS